MTTAKLKELKEDALINVKVNKTYYLMVKNLLYYLFQDLQKEGKITDVKALTTLKYEDMTEVQRSFYTTTLLLAEIEKEAMNNNLYVETEISEEQIKDALDKEEDDTTN